MNVFRQQRTGKHLKLSHYRLWLHSVTCHTDKKEKKIFLIYMEIQSGAVAKSYMRKGFLIYEEMRKYLVIYKEAVSHIWLFATAPFWISLYCIWGIVFLFYQCRVQPKGNPVHHSSTVCVTSLWYPEHHQQHTQHLFVCCLQNCIMINQYWHSSTYICMYVSRSSCGPLYVLPTNCIHHESLFIFH